MDTKKQITAINQIDVAKFTTDDAYAHEVVSNLRDGVRATVADIVGPTLNEYNQNIDTLFKALAISKQNTQPNANEKTVTGRMNARCVDDHCTCAEGPLHPSTYKISLDTTLKPSSQAEQKKPIVPAQRAMPRRLMPKSSSDPYGGVVTMSDA